MKIAVTYENGKVFQHFGHTEQKGRQTSAWKRCLREAFLMILIPSAVIITARVTSAANISTDAPVIK